MSESAAPKSPAAYSYVGGELALFAHALNWKRYFRTHLAPYITGDVLEVGAGIGETTVHLCDGRQSSWTCLEPDPRLATQLTGRLQSTRLAPQPSVVIGSIEQFPRGSAFNTILYIDVLEHIEDDRAELVRAADRLANGGALVILSPAYPWLYSEFDRAVGHYRRYTRKSVARVFPRELVRRRLFYLESAGCLASVANRLLLRRDLPSVGQVAFWDRVLVPCSRVLDPILGYHAGRSVVAVYAKP